MTKPRPCKWCNKPIPSLDPRRITCGHPICTRMQAKTRDAKRDHTTEGRYGERKRPSGGADQRGKNRVLNAWEDTVPNLREWDRLVAVAKETGDSIATVISVLRAEGVIA